MPDMPNETLEDRYAALEELIRISQEEYIPWLPDNQDPEYLEVEGEDINE